MNKKHFFAPSAWRLGGASVRRAATALLLCVLTMTVQTAWAETVTTNYVDANGTTHNGVTATVLTGSETTLEADTWYYLQTSIAYDHALTLGNGEVTLILGNGATMSFPQADIIALNGDYNSLSSLTIYGQTLNDSQAGKLVCTGVHTGIRVRNTYTQHSGTVELSGYRDKLLSAGAATKADGSIIVNGGKLKVNYSDTDDYAIHATKSITFNGGKVEVTNSNRSKAAVQCSYLSDKNNVAGTITLGWTRATDYIRATSYYGNVTLAKDFIDESGTLHTPDNVGSIAGKTLQPAPAVAVTLGQGVTATSGVTTEGGVTYATIGATVTVSVAAPEGYTSSVTYTPEGGEATAATDLGSGSYSFTVPDAAVTVSTALSSTGQPVSVSYMRADGTTATAQAVALDGTEAELGQWGQEKWYFVGAESVTYHATVGLNGSTTIILCDGCTMSIGEDADGKRINGYGINGNTNYALTIYGQSLDEATAGHLKVVTIGNISCYGISYSPYTQHSGNVTVKATSAKAILSYGDVTVNGGTLSATSLADNAVFADDGGDIIINGGKVNATSSTNSALWSWSGDVTINGGQVEATGGSYGIYASKGTITLGWTNATDYIKASSYEGTVQVADGLAFQTDDATPQQVSGTVGNLSLINGKKLSPDLASAFTANSDGSYTIGNAYGWGLFCDRLAASDGKAFFSGKTVRLANDISVTRMAGGQPFTGIFDGDGHTLTLNYGTADAPVDAQFVAPFVETTSDGSNQPTFRNLTIDGTIYEAYSGTDAHNVGGLIGHLYGDVTIEHCTSNLTIYSTGGAGGFVGLCEHTAMFTDCVSSTVITSPGGNNSGFVGWSRASGHAISFEGCVFNGKLLKQNGNGASNGCFIGWTGSNKTVTITNSLCAPAPLADGETMASSNSATFARGWNTTTTATNSYYTQDFNDGEHYTGQGKQLRSIEAGENVSVAHAGVATTYDVSHITAYKASAQGSTFTPGLLYNNNVLYAGSGDQVSLTLANTPPEGYGLDNYTASPEGATLTGSANPYTLTMPDANVTITATFVELTPVSVSYIDGKGVEQTVDAIPLMGTETRLGSSGQETWYVVNSDISHDGKIYCYGDVHIIMADGKTMTVNGGNNYGINGFDSDRTLTIYGQTLGTGTLDASSTGGNAIGHNGNVVICGGTVIATASGSSNNGISASGGVTINGGTVNTTGDYGIIASTGDVTISGGTVNATGYDGICAIDGDVTITGGNVTTTNIYNINGDITITGGNFTATNQISSIWALSGTITLGWTNATDFIKANSYNGTVNIASGKAFTTDGTDIYSGSGVTGINGKTLTPAVAVTLADGITATGGIITTGDDNYAKVGATVTVSTSSVTVPEGYTLGGITVTPAVTVTDQGSGSYSFTVPAANVSVSAQFIMANSIAYIDENGEQQYKQPGEYTVLTGGGATTLDPGWYVVNSDITYTGTVTLGGDVTIILADGAQMNIGTSNNISSYCIKGGTGNYSLTIYGQTKGNGTLYVVNRVSGYDPVYVKNYSQYGGNVTIYGFMANALTLNNGNLTLTRGTLTANAGSSRSAIKMNYGFTCTVSGGTLTANSENAINGSLSMTGGSVEAHGSNFGINGTTTVSGGTLYAYSSYKAIYGNTTVTGGTVTIIGNTYSINGTLTMSGPATVTVTGPVSGNVTIATGQVFTDGNGHYYAGTLTADEKTAINGKTLQPATGMTLAAKAVTEGNETNYWTTFYCASVGFSIDAEENACAYTATVSGETITLHKLGKVIPKNTAVIIVGSDESISMTVSEAVAEYKVEGNHLHGVDVATALDDVKSTYGADAILVLSNKNQHFGFHVLATTNVPARKAFLALSGETAKAREFTMVFDDATGIHSIDNGQLIMDNEAGAWYSLDGRRLSGKPTQKGLYIHNGTKVTIK